MKIIKVFHPDWKNSVYTKKWIEENKNHYQDFALQIHSDDIFDIKKEKTILKQATKIIFVFPMYWYYSPWNGKKYQDLILEYKMDLSKLEFELVVFCGQNEAYFQENTNGSVLMMMRSFIKSLTFCDAKFKNIKSFYDCKR